MAKVFSVKHRQNWEVIIIIRSWFAHVFRSNLDGSIRPTYDGWFYKILQAVHHWTKHTVMFLPLGGVDRNGSALTATCGSPASPWVPNMWRLWGLEVAAASPERGSVLRWGARQTDANTAVGRSTSTTQCSCFQSDWLSAWVDGWMDQHKLLSFSTQLLISWYVLKRFSPGRLPAFSRWSHAGHWAGLTLWRLCLFSKFFYCSLLSPFWNPFPQI